MIGDVDNGGEKKTQASPKLTKNIFDTFS